MGSLLRRLCKDTQGQGIAEYAVMMAVVLTLIVTTVQLIGLHAREIFVHVASALR
jgi:Flp pilus assembly pilin Flp